MYPVSPTERETASNIASLVCYHNVHMHDTDAARKLQFLLTGLRARIATDLRAFRRRYSQSQWLRASGRVCGLGTISPRCEIGFMDTQKPLSNKKYHDS